MLNIYNYHTHPEKLIKATHIIEQDGGLYVGNFYGDGIILSKKSMERELSWDDGKKYCDDLGWPWQLPQLGIMKFILEQKTQFLYFDEYVLDANDYWTNRETADYGTTVDKDGRTSLQVKTNKFAIRPVKVL